MKFLIKLVTFCALMATLQMVSGLLDPIDMLGRLTFASTTSNYRLMASLIPTAHNYSYWAQRCEGKCIHFINVFAVFVTSKCIENHQHF